MDDNIRVTERSAAEPQDSIDPKEDPNSISHAGKTRLD